MLASICPLSLKTQRPPLLKQAPCTSLIVIAAVLQTDGLTWQYSILRVPYGGEGHTLWLGEHHFKHGSKQHCNAFVPSGARNNSTREGISDFSRNPRVSRSGRTSWIDFFNSNFQGISPHKWGIEFSENLILTWEIRPHMTRNMWNRSSGKKIGLVFKISLTENLRTWWMGKVQPLVDDEVYECYTYLARN